MLPCSDLRGRGARRGGQGRRLESAHVLALPCPGSCGPRRPRAPSRVRRGSTHARLSSRFMPSPALSSGSGTDARGRR
jgi:hypothetical protein